MSLRSDGQRRSRAHSDYGLFLFSNFAKFMNFTRDEIREHAQR